MLELEQAKKRAAELRALIEYNNRLYYDQDAPELEDFQYDALTRELRELETAYPELVTPDSPTQHVGGTPSGRFAKVTHAVKMESLLDAFSYEELRDFDRRVRDAGVEPEYVVEIKIDGLSCSLEYENGQLVRASTRGDGVVGEDVTENVRAIRSIPKTLKGDDLPAYLEVRGEVYMPHDVFQKLCEEQELQGAAPFKNPRNAAAGSLRQKDPRITGSRGLGIFIFNVQQVQGVELTSHAQSLDYLKALGLPVSPRYHLVKDIDAAIAENPTNTDLWFGRGRIFYALKNYDESIKSFEKIVELKPDMYEGNYYLGFFYALKGDAMNKEMNERQYSSQADYDADLKTVNAVYMAAVPWFEKVLELKPNDPDAVEFLKSLCFRLRDEEGMMDKYKKYNDLYNQIKGN